MRECSTCLRCFDDEVIHCPDDGQGTINSVAGTPTLDGRYLLERRLGQGGMGVVYKAQHVFLKSRHAIKIIMPDLVGNDPSVATRFRQEAMAAAAIRHSNIISVTDYGFVGESPFLVMEFVEGESLQEVMTRHAKFTPEQALEYFRPIAAGVGEAHRQKIIHRDLKPLNIMLVSHRSLTDGLKILDFGLAKIKSGELLGSFVGAKTTGIIGSPYYMAPEQWSDEEPDGRCDIYSLGIILHQMLMGDVPFKGTSIPAVMKKHLMTPPPPLVSPRGKISEALERVVHHALEKEPEARTGTAEELLAELEDAVNSLSIAGKRAARRRNAVIEKPGISGVQAGVVTIDPPEPKKPRRRSPRITAEQKKAQLEQKIVAHTTAEQEEPRVELNQNVENRENIPTPPLAISRSEAPTELLPTNAPGLVSAPQPDPVIEVKSAERQSISQSGRNKIISREFVVSSQQLEVEGELRLEEQESWRRAAEDARRRAEQRALLEMDSGVGQVMSVPRPSVMAAPIPSAPQPVPRAPEIPVAGWASELPSFITRKPWVLATAFAVLITGLLVFLLARTRPETEQAIKTNLPNGIASPKRDMILVKGGSFMMGWDQGDVLQRPSHLVTVSDFSMDKTEVTNAEYAAFIKATGHPAPSSEQTAKTSEGYWIAWNGSDPPAGRNSMPVCNVTVKDAEAFAKWLSQRDGVTYRLPTEEEWEYAARNGSQNTLFPWGNSWLEGRASLNGMSSPRHVGSFPEGHTQNGIMDMVGNVWEWTSSKGSYYEPKEEQESERTANRSANIVRGGSFWDVLGAKDSDGKVIFSNATSRQWNRNDRDYKHPAIGFRLVR